MDEPRPIDYPAGGQVRTGRLYRGRGGSPRPVVVVVHGLLGSSRLREIEIVCRGLVGEHDVVSIDLRGHGNAPGVFTWGRCEPADLSDLISFLHGLHPSVGVLGFSIGGAIAILGAAQARSRVDPARPEALCVVGTPAHLDLWRFRLRPLCFLKNLGPILRRRTRWVRPGWLRPSACRPVDHVAGVSPAPLMLVHGDDDWLVHPSHARLLYEAAGPPKELVMVKGGLHAEFMVGQDPDSVLAPARRFFAATLTAGDPESIPEVTLNRDKP